MKIAVSAGIFLLLASAALGELFVKKYKKHGKFDPSAVHSISNSNNKLSLSLYQTLISNLTDKNVIISPISIELALGLTYFGAGGSTAKQMASVLHLPEDHDVVKGGFRHLIGSLKKSGTTELDIANRLYVQNDFIILKEFRRTARKVFGSDVKEINFMKNAEKARKIVNNWVEKRTKDNIKQIIGPGVFTMLTRLVVVNAVYFKANWMQPFNSEDTRTEPFYINSKEQINIPTMHIKSFYSYKYIEKLKTKILELPYEDDTSSMMILLPDEIEGLPHLEVNLPTIDMASIFADMETEELNVSLPIFRIEETLDLKSLLKEIGIKDLFDEKVANLSGITGNPDLFVSQVVQKAFVQVTELGTEAGASTALVADARSWRPPPEKFTVNHPFLFVIWHKKLNTPLFIGRFIKPQ